MTKKHKGPPTPEAHNYHQWPDDITRWAIEAAKDGDEQAAKLLTKAAEIWAGEGGGGLPREMQKFLAQNAKAAIGAVRGGAESARKRISKAAEYQQAVNAVAKQHPHWKITAIRQQVADDLGKSLRTIENNTKDPRKTI